MSAPLVSVLMPCFNHGAFIRDAIQSVLDQTLPDAEVIVVDDGSTDPETRALLGSLDMPRTRVLRTANQGLPAARNFAARHAQGRLLCALDADDRLAPAWFERGAAVLDAHPDVAFVSHWLQTFGDEHWTWTPASCELPALLARNTVNGAALVRREAFDAVGGYDASMRDGCEDWDFWLRLVERGYRGHIVPEILFFYRRTATSMSRLMTASPRYEAPLRTRVATPEASYRDHLIDVLVAGAAESLHLQRELSGMERTHATRMEPALRRAREELAALADKVERVRPRQEHADEHERLVWKAAELERDVAALRSSWSWRITAPLRRMFAIVTGETRK